MECAMLWLYSQFDSKEQLEKITTGKEKQNMSKQTTIYNLYPRLKRYYKVVNDATVLNAFFDGILNNDEYFIMRDVVEQSHETNTPILEIAGFQVM